MSKIRLAYLLGRMEPGGAELQMTALIRYLTDHGFRVDVVTRAGAGSLDGKVRAAGGRIRATGQLSTIDTPTYVAYARRLSRPARWVAMARKRYDVVDAWLYPSDVEAALTRPLTMAPVVMSARLGRSPRRHFGPLSVAVDFLVNRLTDVVVANSDVSASDSIRGGVPADRVRVIRGGVRMPRLYTGAERRAQRAALGVSDGHLLLGNVGNFRSMKRQDLLLDAFASLIPDHPELRLVLVGDGDLRRPIEHQVARLGLSEHVRLTGSIADVEPVYAALDLFVQASDSEGLPNVLLEASATGLPIVATAAGGSDEVVHDGETGLLVPVNDTGRLASAIGRLAADADLRTRLGAAARALVERDYEMERFFREYADLYREQLAAKGALPEVA